MGFEPTNELERALVAAAHDPAQRPEFYRNLTAADVFVLQDRVSTATGEHRLHAGETLRLQTWDREGTTVVPMFSSLPRLEAFIRAEASYLRLNALELMRITQGAALVLNPRSDYGKDFAPNEIAAILDGSILQPAQPHTVEEPTEVMIGEPANYPQELVDALARLFRQSEQVQRAFLAHFYNPAQDERPHTLIALQATGDWDRLVGEVGLVASEVDVPDPPVSFVQMTGHGPLDEYFEGTAPFYQR